ncbi:hypothetical protein N7486_002388 [Penicillium sp. IBT 16267x]|nr:hypothetical protein N7486_002388 [Penicillium sp. IBT 16267x]
MAGFYTWAPSSTERGGLTAKELLYAQMPRYFGLRDCTTAYVGRYSALYPLTAYFHVVISSTYPVLIIGFNPRMPVVHIVDVHSMI